MLLGNWKELGDRKAKRAHGVSELKRRDIEAFNLEATNKKQPPTNSCHAICRQYASFQFPRWLGAGTVPSQGFSRLSACCNHLRALKSRLSVPRWCPRLIKWRDPGVSILKAPRGLERVATVDNL